MIFLSHRGYWLNPEEKNTSIAFNRSFDLNFGTETDVRDCRGEILISHDMPQGNELSLPDFFKMLGRKKNLPLAINIKADGLAAPLKQAFHSQGITNWFVFDMSTPDMRGYLQANISVFTRMSEVEKDPPFLEQAAGIWLDAFSNIWYDIQLIKTLLQNRKQVCIVSSELHGREPDNLWKMLLPLSDHPSLMLCTDRPEQAQTFFGKKSHD